MVRLALLLFVIACGGSKTSAPVDPAAPPPAPGAGSASSCITTGCSGSICTEPGNEMVTTCEMKPEYQCYQAGECKVQADGKCGWTMDDRMQSCLASPPPLQ